jgi:GDP-D-mannose 3', 5'-epimerase
MCLSYAKDFPIKTRIARYHNVYGPRGTWKGRCFAICFLCSSL